ncbi:YedE-related selenium metabolism membrane protein [Geomonas sp. RF6]|uniref:YedE family putative selenium transporter n=1 Tax=Geomonas sp. RF6 TaxID=2897342 RepID=UPI001E5E82C9|nr:YedE family putative selenium transporter [Geomonas sp. RF6]UFS70309.1 YedE-related selenium metabolism membrane protein [Geomonas sp. RF6]
MTLRDRHLWLVVACGVALGALGVLLAVLGNPENSGICVSCFMENVAGGLGLHDNSRMQYLRPELSGFVLGAFLSALFFREFRTRGGSAPLSRLFAGILLMVGCGVFIGCPIKLLLRLGAGDLGALAGVAGLIAGVWVGTAGLARGAELPHGAPQPGASGILIPAAALALLALVVGRPGMISFSTMGSGSQHAPWAASLAGSVVLGALAQRSRFCITGGIRDLFVLRWRGYLFYGVLAFALSAFAASVAAGRFHPGLAGQPGAHVEHLWSFLGMGLVGWTATLVGGCPFRQLVKAGEGDTDAGLLTVGMLLGGALVQSLGLGATTAGVPLAGKLAVLLGVAVLAGHGLGQSRTR